MAESETCGNVTLLLDQACLEITNNGSNTLTVYMQYAECYKCSMIFLFELASATSNFTLVRTISETLIKYRNNKSFSESFQFGQGGRYSVTVGDDFKSSIKTIAPPDDANKPLKIVLCTIFIATILWMIGKYVWQFYFSSTCLKQDQENGLDCSRTNGTGKGDELASGSMTSTSEDVKSTRLQFIDTFRGLTLMLMLFVNYGGGAYWFFYHAPWNGMTFADAVFPSFAFIMGMSLFLSMSAQFRLSNSRMSVLSSVLRRSAILICLGLMKNSFFKTNIYRLRVLGVLQKLGLTYLIIGTIQALSFPKHFPQMEREGERVWSALADRRGLVEWLLALSLVAAHSLVTFLLQVPGCPRGYLGPGGLHLYRSAASCTGGAAGYIDRRLFTSNHTISLRRLLLLYDPAFNFEPECLLGTLNAAFTVFLGVFAMRFYSAAKNPIKVMMFWLICSLVFGLIGGELCGWSKEEGLIPLNRSLWSLSFTLVNASISFLAISILYFVIDYKKVWNGSPFKEVGRNALILYVLQEVFNVIPWRFSPIDYTTHTQPLLLDCWSTFLWIVTAVILAKRRIFIVV